MFDWFKKRLDAEMANDIGKIKFGPKLPDFKDEFERMLGIPPSLGGIKVDKSHWNAMKAIMSAQSGMANSTPNPDTSPAALGNMIDMRLRTPPGKFMFQFMQAFKMKNEKVVVFIVQNDQPTFLEDDWALFPSDELVTKLRLILG